jgi:N-acetylneuraminic acid mutarotase
MSNGTHTEQNMAFGQVAAGIAGGFGDESENRIVVYGGAAHILDDRKDDSVQSGDTPRRGSWNSVEG